jgi:predicted N-formylglutamate amidohydrolase
LESSPVPNTLLSHSDPNPVKKSGISSADAPFLLIGDHAGSAIPNALGDLGLAPADRARHIALDIGVEELGPKLAERLGAPFLRQVYSRLVIDCNREPARLDAIPEVSDQTRVSGNSALGDAARQSRIDEVFTPYHRAIAEELDARAAAGRETVLVALHSFTPVMNGFARPWEIGILYHKGDTSFALAMLERLRQRPGPVVAANEPYAMDGTDYTVPHHAYPRGLRYVEIEIRQDLIDPGTPNRSEEFIELLSQDLEACA